jgi:hypothetical protein
VQLIAQLRDREWIVYFCVLLLQHFLVYLLQVYLAVYLRLLLDGVFLPAV